MTIAKAKCHLQQTLTPAPICIPDCHLRHQGPPSVPGAWGAHHSLHTQALMMAAWIHTLRFLFSGAAGQGTQINTSSKATPLFKNRPIWL